MAGVMLNALAPAGPAAPALPPAPASSPDTEPQVQRETFKDVYHTVPAGPDANSEEKPKPKSSDTNHANAKDPGDGDRNDKAIGLVASAPHSPVLLKAPLAFTLALFSQAPESQAAQVEASDSTAEPAQQTESADGKAASPRVEWLGEEAPPVPASAPRNETIAFKANLTQMDAPPSVPQSTRASLPMPARSPVNKEARIPLAPSTSALAAKDISPGDIKLSRSEAMLPVRQLAAASALDLRPAALSSTAEGVHAGVARTLAVQDAQPILPEIPKPPASSEILLHLAGKDQSTASVRIVDRSGSVNVVVHASDPEVRSTLRSNLSDLASQLSSQGFKTEVVKPAVSAANAENQQDSRSNHQHASGQQQHSSTPDGRQPQRDRRANSQRWLEQLEQQTSGASGSPRGTN